MWVASKVFVLNTRPPYSRLATITRVVRDDETGLVSAYIVRYNDENTNNLQSNKGKYQRVRPAWVRLAPLPPKQNLT